MLVDGVAVSETPATEPASADVEGTPTRRAAPGLRRAVAVVAPGSTRAGLPPSALVEAYVPGDAVPPGVGALWLEHGALVGIRGASEEVGACWVLPELGAQLVLETCVVPSVDPPDLEGGLAAIEGVSDLVAHGIEVMRIHVGECIAAGLVGEVLRYRMRAPDGDVYQAIWCFGGTPDSVCEPWARLELTAPAERTEQAEDAWAEILAGLRRDAQA